MKYIHQKEYKGLKFNTPNNQKITMNYVEEFCLKCDKFMGQEHDFSECQKNDIWEKGRLLKPKDCPFRINAVSLIHPQIKYKISEK